MQMVMLTREQVREAKSALRLYKTVRKKSFSGHEQLRDGAYDRAAAVARCYIMQEVSKGRAHVYYGDIAKLLDTDRFTVAQVLGVVLAEDTRLDTGTLWSCFVGYKKEIRSGSGRIMYREGEPGGQFYSYASELGWQTHVPSFLHILRQHGLAKLGAATWP